MTQKVHATLVNVIPRRESATTFDADAES